MQTQSIRSLTFALFSLMLGLGPVGCDGDGKKGAAADAKESEAKPAGEAKADPKVAAVDEEGEAKAAAAAEVEAQEKAHAKVTELLPKLYEYGTKDEAIKEIAAIGTHAIGTLSAQLVEHLAAYATAMEAFGSGKKGSRDDALVADQHMKKVHALLETLEAVGDDGVVAAKKALDELPEDKQKDIADMFRARHGLFD